MIGNTALFGYGDSIEEAKADLWAVIYECREEIRIKKGCLSKELEQINITFVVETDYYKKIKSDEQMKEIGNLLSDYFAKKAIEEADRLWDEKIIDCSTIEKWKSEHMRTSY